MRSAGHGVAAVNGRRANASAPVQFFFLLQAEIAGRNWPWASLFKGNILPTTLVWSSFCIWLLSYATALGCKTEIKENAKFSVPLPFHFDVVSRFMEWDGCSHSSLFIHKWFLKSVFIHPPARQCIYLWQMELYWFDWESWLETVPSKLDYSGLILNLGFLHSDPRMGPDAGFCPQCLNLTLREHQDSSLGRMNVRMREHIVCLRGWDRVTRWGGATCSGMFTWICHCIYIKKLFFLFCNFVLFFDFEKANKKFYYMSLIIWLKSN